MRVRVIDVEGTPEELTSSQQLLEILKGTSDVARAGATDEVEEDTPPSYWQIVPEHVKAFVLSKTPDLQRQALVIRFIGEVMQWGDTEVEIGTSRNTPDRLADYLMLRHSGPRRFGAFAYVKPRNGGVTLRLGRSDAETSPFGRARRVKPGTGYEVTCPLRSKDAVDEALRLARLALDRVSI